METEAPRKAPQFPTAPNAKIASLIGGGGGASSGGGSPRGVPSGLADAERLLTKIPQISFNYFTSKDVVRHPLVAAIIEAYEAEG